MPMIAPRTPPGKMRDALPRAAASALAAFAVVLLAQWAYVAYDTGGLTAAAAGAAARGAVVFTMVFALGALVGFGIPDPPAATLPMAALLGAVSAVPLAMVGGFLAGSFGLAGAAAIVACGAALVAYAGGGGLRR